MIYAFRNLYRLCVVIGTLIHYRLDQSLLPKYCAPSHLWPFGRRLLQHDRGVRLAKALERLGPCYIKLGQLLSMRGDLLPPDIVLGLAALQDEVMPFDGVLAKKMLTDSLKQPFEDVFQSFDLEPLGSASVAQVHPAVLRDGRDVVVKIVRPNLRKKIKKDIALFLMLAGLVKRLFPWARALKPESLIDEFSHHIYLELNLMVEAGNASLLRRNAQKQQGLLKIPEVYWDCCTESVMVMERISGVKVDDLATLNKANVNLAYLAESGLKIFFTQVFQDRFFHADMHPGNLFVNIDDPEKPFYQAVDFGIMGSLSPTDQRYLAENMLAFFKGDYQRVAVLHIQSGWVRPDVRVDQFEAAIRSVCEPMFARPLKDISLGRLLLQLFRTAHAFSMEVQPQLMLLQKTLLSVESLGRMLYPELDLWSTAKPFLEEWMKDQMGAKAFLRKSKENFPYWLEKMPDMPERIFDFLQTHTEAAKHRAEVDASRFPQQAKQMHASSNRLSRLSIGLLAFSLGAAVVWVCLAPGLS